MDTLQTPKLAYNLGSIANNPRNETSDVGASHTAAALAHTRKVVLMCDAGIFCHTPYFNTNSYRQHAESIAAARVSEAA